MNKLYFFSILLISLFIFSFPQTLLSQEDRLAVVTNYNGEVKVQHNGVWQTVTKVGNRIRNSSVYNGDTILTAPGSNVELVFSDNTNLKIEENTTLTISTRPVNAADRAKQGFVRNVAGTQQEVVRNIKVKTGKLWSHITPSKSILTEFESPTGTAAVRGTVLTFTVFGGKTGINLIKGLLDFISAGSKATFDFDTGDALTISEVEPGKTKVNIESGEITLRTSQGTVTIGDGASLDLQINPDTGSLTVNSSEGDVTITTADGTTTDVKAGDDLGTTDSKSDQGSEPDQNPESKPDQNTKSDSVEDPDSDSDQDEDQGELSGDDITEMMDDMSYFDEEGDNTVDPFSVNSEGKNTIVDDFNPGEISLSNTNSNVATNDQATSIIDEPKKVIFEDDFSNGLGKWVDQENVSVATSFGSIVAKSGDANDKFAIINYLPDDEDHKTTGKLGAEFDVPEGGIRNITFDYNFATTDIFDRNVDAHLHRSDNVKVTFDLSLDNLTAFVGPDSKDAYETGWRSIDWTGFIPAGKTLLHFIVFDDDDNPNNENESVLLLDNVVDPIVDGDYHEDTNLQTGNVMDPEIEGDYHDDVCEEEPTNTNVWLTFAKLIRDDVDTGDMDDLAVVECNKDQDFVDNIENAINDLEDNPGTLSLNDIFGNIWAENNIIFEPKENESEQHASVALLLLTANELAERENGFTVNLDVIRDSLRLAQTFMEEHINDFGDTFDTNIKVLIDGILTKIDETWDPNDLLTTNTIKGEIKDAFCNIVNNLNHSNSMEEENPFHFCHGNMDEGT